MVRGPRTKDEELAKEFVHFTPQFDLITGEQLSPVYSIDESPIPLLSPQGVNNNLYPQSFSYSYPLADLQYKRAAYYNAGIPTSPPVSSTIKSFTSVSYSIIISAERCEILGLTNESTGRH
jgi:hypothetical protein